MNMYPLICLCVALAGCGKVAPVAEHSAAPVLVEVARVATAPGGMVARYTGTVRVKREIALGFKTPGIIESIAVNEGARVQRGQPLARLITTELVARERTAAALYHQAQTEHSRTEALIRQGWATQQRLESINQQLQSAKAELDAARFDVERSVLHAPASGIVLRRFAEPNQTMAAGAPVITVADLTSGYVLRVSLSDTELAHVHVGARASVTLAGIAPRALPATVRQIAARSNEQTGTFEVELSLPQVPGLRSGLIGEAVMDAPATTRRTGMMSVPATALINGRADEAFVYVVGPASHVATARLVGIAGYSDTAVKISSGLNGDELIVVDGADRVQNGKPVRFPIQGK